MQKSQGTKLPQKNDILRALAGSTWGCDKELIINTFKALGRSSLNYAAPVWTPFLSDTAWSRLQAAQNSALRIATGSTRMSQISHLHTETKILPVKDHNELLSTQFLLSTTLPDHPCGGILKTEPPPRAMRRTLSQNYGQKVRFFTNDDNISSKQDYMKNLTILHTDTVIRAKLNYEHNKVLGAAPPQIDESEKSLSRRARTYLSQLRSGYSPLLATYRNRIDPSVPPDCGGAPQTTAHLFECSNNPTQLTTASLWSQPIDAAEFLCPAGK